ncbi:MAG: hypothetical protein KAG99_06390, partial [Bacteroidales bacterium]|nr:hypothetical protein [Bacteroidales bacterium]
DATDEDTRITGCGIDAGTRNQVQQTHMNCGLGEHYNNTTNSYWMYQVDTENASSGSPIITEDYSSALYTLGIHTTGGCDAGSTGCSTSEGYNKGTSFENNDLESAIQTFPGSTVKYVDNGHTLGGDDGTIFRPYSTVTQGVSGVTTGGILSIVKGYYNESSTLTITKAMTIEAPVGSVTIY